MTNELQVAAPSAMMDPQRFEHMCRVGRMLALSPLFPEHLRKGGVEVGVANAVLCQNMAYRLREDVLTVAQNIYFVAGKPGWSASYMIGKARQSGTFRGGIEWEIKGEGNDLKVTAFAELAETGRRVEVTITMAEAKAEGWTSNKKYQTMPQRMLQYRTGTALVRLYCPEVMIGLPYTHEELEDGDTNATMRDITPPVEPKPAAAKAGAKPKEEAKPKAEAKAAPKETKKAADDAELVEGDARGDSTPEPEAEVAEEFAGLVEILMNEIATAEPNDVNDVLSSYEIEMQALAEHSAKLHQEVLAAAAERRSAEAAA